MNRDFRIQYGAVGDAKLVLRQLIEETKRQLGEAGRDDVHGVRDEIANIKTEFMAAWGPRLTSDETPINPYRVFHDVMHTVDPSETIITHDLAIQPINSLFRPASSPVTSGGAVNPTRLRPWPGPRR